MLVTKVICPHCAKHLKTSKPFTVGHRILCPHCGRSFAVPADAVDAIASGASVSDRTPKPLTLPPLVPRPDPAHIQTAANLAPIPGSPRGNQTLWIGIIFGGLLFLMATTAGLALYFAGHSQAGDAQALTDAATPDKSDAGLVDPPTSDAPASLPSNLPPDAPPLSPRPGNRPPRLDPPSPTSPSPEPESATGLPAEEQEKVNKAIDRGVSYLKKTQGAGGAWGPRIGLAALPGLTLLECGVPAGDAHVQKTLRHIRLAIPHLNTTYDLALAILFLDRLGDPKDEQLIRTCALRLVAGQTPSGGWTYTCRILKPVEEKNLLEIMQITRPSKLEHFVNGSSDSALSGFITKSAGTLPEKDIQGETTSKPRTPDGGVAPLEKRPFEGKEYKKALDRLPVDLRKVPALQPPAKSNKRPSRDVSDNSNTQFAILGLSAAHRHNLPLERSLALIVQRFRTTQAPDGHWGYHTVPPVGDPAMTGAGLLGLAVGMGLAADHGQPKIATARAKDTAVEKGFASLAQAIGKPLGWKKPRGKGRSPINMYFLWTTERVGVLFNRRQIGGKDWYSWGAELILDRQNANGSWMGGNYPGTGFTTDTCFALLFLKRANLAKDLTKKLEFFMEGKKLQE